MVQKIKSFIQLHNLLQVDDHLIVGVSGGADSVALFFVLLNLKEEWNLTLDVVHIHHGIREEADADADYVKSLCEKWDVGFHLYYGNIPDMAKSLHMSEEEAGRQFRYDCFEKEARRVGANKIAVAHHQNDQAETILFHLIRGSNLRGLAGMEPLGIRPDKPSLIRPLLCVNRTEIEDFLKTKGVAWCEDITNEDNSYARNALRNLVIPAMEKINSQAVDHIAKLAQQMDEYDRYFRMQTDEYIEKNIHENPDGSMSVNRYQLQNEMPVFAKAVLYRMRGLVSGKKKDIAKCHVEDLYDLLGKQSGKEICLPYGIKAKLVYEKLVLRICLEEESMEEQIYLKDIIWEENKKYKVTIKGYGTIKFECRLAKDLSGADRENLSGNIYTKYFDCDTIMDTLCVRTPCQDDYICINKDGTRKKLMQYLKNEKIAADERKRIPVLAFDHEILYVAGYRRCEDYKISDDTKKILMVSYEGEKNGSD